MLRSRSWKFWKVGVGYFTFDSASLVKTGNTVREVWYTKEQNELGSCHLGIRFAF